MSDPRLKVLFVTHSVDPMGGAARSLRELIDGWDVEADLLVPRFNGAPDDRHIRDFFGPRVRRIFRRWLAFDLCYRGRPPLWQSARRYFLFPLMWRAGRNRFHRFVARERYDLVHLNSVVLHPVTRVDQPFVLHVREILDGEQPSALDSAERARAVVFIDEATRAPFAAASLPVDIVLNNPVDMRNVGHLPPDAAARIGGDPARLTVFAMIGTLIPEKGVDTVIDAFRRVESADARLLIVGTGDADYTRRLARLAAGDRRIIFWGNESSVADVYTLSDWVVRGEAYHCIGRTIYEALYSGCGAIVPGDAATQTFFEYERFTERIRFYRPSNRAELCGVFTALIGCKFVNKIGASNTREYVARFDQFVRAAIGRPVV